VRASSLAGCAWLGFNVSPGTPHVPLPLSPQPVRDPSRNRRLLREPLRLGRRRSKRLESPGVRGGDLQAHLAGIDRADLLSRDVANLPGSRRLDGQAVKDVALFVAFDLRNRADDDPVGRNDVPTLRNLQPRNRISHWVTLTPGRRLQFKDAHRSAQAQEAIPPAG